MEKNKVVKYAALKSLEATDAELEKINRFTLEPVKAGDVFTFRAMAADNEQDDRNFEPFNAHALEQLKDLYIGKTVIFDHLPSAKNQVARVYDAEIVADESRKTELGEAHAELFLKLYMVKTEENAGLIAEIKGGIKREVSTGCIASKMLCSICGKDVLTERCRHFPGKTYGTDGKDKPCKYIIDSCSDALELSFVALPAQPRAGVSKSEKGEEIPDNTEVTARLKLNDAFIFTNKEEKT